MVKRGTGPRSLMEGLKGCQEPSGGLAVCVMCRTELSMSSSVCELSVETQSL